METKTLQQIKDEHAKYLGYKDWEDLQYFDYDIVNTDEVIHEIAKRYARECIKNIIKSITYDSSGIDRCTWGDTEYDSKSVEFGYNEAVNYIKMLITKTENILL